MRFDQSIRGLAVGALVDFSGITLGNVTSINLDFDPETKRFYSVVDATLYPERLGSVMTRSGSWPIRKATWPATGCWAA